MSNLGATNQTAAHQTQLKHGDEFLSDTTTGFLFYQYRCAQSCVVSTWLV